MQESKICFFNTTKTWGGGEKWHSEMSIQLHSAGYKVLVVTQHNSALYNKVHFYGVPCISVKLTNFSFVNPLRLYQLVKLFKDNNVKTLVMNLPNDLKAAGLAARIAGVKHIIYRRGSAIAVRNTFVNRFYYGKIIHSVLANSKATAEKILQNNKHLIEKEKIHIVYNGLDLNDFDKIKAKRESRYNENEFIIGNIGRLVKQKAQEKLIDLAVILKKEKLPFKIVIGGDGERKQKLQQYAKTMGVEDKIIWEGFVSDVKQFFVNIDVFVLTSLWEGFGYVLAEAMAARKPVIGFNISSNPELIRDNENGYLIEPDNIKQLAERLITLYHNPEKVKRFGEKGRAIVETEFTPSNTLKGFLTLVKEYEV